MQLKQSAIHSYVKKNYPFHVDKDQNMWKEKLKFNPAK